jgi:peroxiredoxin
MAEHPRLVAARLVGRRFPMVKMENWHWRGWVQEMTRGCLYVYPGGGSSPVDPVEDVALHRAFREHCKGVEVRGVSTRAARLQLHSVAEYELEHDLYSDDELRLAKALGLPTFRAEGQWFYERLIAVVDARRITRVFYPVDDVNCATQALAWLRFHR